MLFQFLHQGTVTGFDDLGRRVWLHMENPVIITSVYHIVTRINLVMFVAAMVQYSYCEVNRLLQ